MNDTIEQQIKFETARTLHRLASQKYAEYHVSLGEDIERPAIRWGKFIPAPEKRERYARFA